MNNAIDFLPPAEPRPYPLHLRQNLAADRDRLSDLARELGYEAKDWSYLALAEMQRYRNAMHAYRQASPKLAP
jgi:hypothetical protein